MNIRIILRVLTLSFVSLARAQDIPIAVSDRGFDEPSYARDALREGQSPFRGPHLSLSMPAQISARDVEYWVWLLDFDEDSTRVLRAAIGAWIPADDVFRMTKMPKLFRYAGAAVAPNAEIGKVGVMALARDIMRTRTAILSEMSARERDAFATAFTTDDPDAEEPLAVIELELLRLVDLDNGAVDTLAAAQVDVGRFIAMFGTRLLSESSSNVARSILRESLPSIAELSRAHLRAIGLRLGAGVKVNAAALGQSGEARIPSDDRKLWNQERARARRQVATAAQRLFEANNSVMDAICTAIPEAESRVLRLEYMTSVFGPMATAIWDADEFVAQLSSGGAVDPGSLDELRADYREQLGASAREVQRVVMSYRVQVLGSTGTGREAWTKAHARLTSLHAQQRILVEGMLGQLRALAPESQRSAVETIGERTRLQCEIAATAQLDALDPYHSKSSSR